MKLMLFAAAAAGLMLGGVSCERHSWDETKKLHEKHGGDDGHAEAAGHAEGSGAEASGHEEGGGAEH